MSEIKRCVIISASPRTNVPTTSAFISSLAETRLTAQGIAVQQIEVRKSLKGDMQTDFAAMRAADALLIIFPLYFFCVPGMLMAFLQDYAAYHVQHGSQGTQHVYTIVNCGFPEPDINSEAIRVIESFSRHIGATFEFGVGIGGGGMMEAAKDAPFMKTLFVGLDNAFASIAQGTGGDNVTLAPRFPRRLYFMAGNMGWHQMARKNGLKKKDLYRKPYAQ